MSLIDVMILNMKGAKIFSVILPSLLTLAIVFGILDHYNMPKSKSARGTIAIVLALLSWPIGGTIAPFMTDLVKGLIVVASGILVTIIFVEMLGFKASGSTKNIFEQHPREFGLVLIILATIVFTGAGGASLLGLNVRIGEGTLALLFFLAVIVVGVWWITAEKKGE